MTDENLRHVGSNALGEDAAADVKRKLEFLPRHGLPDGRVCRSHGSQRHCHVFCLAATYLLYSLSCSFS